MGLQLIFVVETNNKCKSDWIYIKDTIEKFYQYNKAQVKFSTVYMNGKGNYKKREKDIKKLISQYSVTNKLNVSKVIFCFDCDDYDTKDTDAVFLSEAFQYCKEKGYKFVWFCKDVECVYIGQSVANSEKTKKATMFKQRKLIDKIDERQLNAVSYQKGRSNILNVLSECFDGKIDRKK